MLAAHLSSYAAAAAADHDAKLLAHPSPTDSEAPGSKASSSALADSHSESSHLSPGSPHSDGRALSGDEVPQDLSLPKRRTSDGGGAAVKSEPGTLAEAYSSGARDLQCTICGCLFATELQLKLHVQERHIAALGGDQHYFAGSQTQRQCDEKGAIASLLTLQSSVGNCAGERPNGAAAGKIFNLEAYCEICQKEFCNKYYLQTHKATKHGVPPSMGGMGMFGGGLPMGGAPVNYGAESKLGAPPTSAALFPPTSLNVSAGGFFEVRCPLCAQCVADQYSLQLHMLTAHPMGQMSANPAMLQALYAAQLMGLGQPAVPQLGLGAPTSTALSLSAVASGSPQALADRIQRAAMAGMVPSQLPFPMTASPSVNPLATLGQSHLSPAPAPPPSTVQLRVSPPHGHAAAPTPSVHPSLAEPIVNKDAYCDLCQKEFCNKYFLRTHMAKRHNVGADVTPNSAQKRPATSVSSSPPQPLNGDAAAPTDSPPRQQLTFNSLISQAPQTPAESKAEATPTSLLNEALTAPPLNMHSSSVIVNPQTSFPSFDSDLAKHLKLDISAPLHSAISTNGKAMVPPQQTAAPANGDYQAAPYPCGLCTRSFPSKFSLVAHSYTEHGGAYMDISALSGLPNTTAMSSTPAKELQQLGSPVLDAVDPDAYCDICKKEFCSKYFLRTHMRNIHNVHTEPTPPHGNGVATDGGEAARLNAALVGTPPKSDASPAVGGARPRPKYLTGRNFCDICNKEVCNKYFLRTHMFKMHGIVIDENKTVIANIDTLDRERAGGLLFRCDVCNQQTQSRQALKTHKLAVHGIVPTPTSTSAGRQLQSAPSYELDASLPTMVAGAKVPPPPSTSCGRDAPPNVTVTPSGPPMLNGDSPCVGRLEDDRSYSDVKEVCPVCDDRFASTRSLQAHMRAEHSNDVSEDVLASFQQSTEEYEKEQQAALTVEPYPCDYCEQRFGDVIPLQLHVINEHASEVKQRANSLAAQAALDSVGQPALSADVFAQPPSTEQCSPIHDDNTVFESMAPKSSPPMVVRKDGSKCYRCSYCSYYTKWVSNLSVHERRHTGGTPKEERPFVCSICLRAYRYAHSLERHKQVHRFVYQRQFGSPDKHTAAVAESQSCEQLTRVSPTAAAGGSGAPSLPPKRYRCTKCEKVFKSRDLCRSHLYAVHRRQQTIQLLSPSKRAAADDYKSVFEVVEELHREQQAGAAPVSQTRADGRLADGRALQPAEAAVAKGTYALGFGTPAPSNESARPYALQPFLMRQLSDDAQSSALLSDAVVYLPVSKRLSEPLLSQFQLVPMKLPGEIQTV